MRSFGTGTLYGGLRRHWNAIVPGYFACPMSTGFPRSFGYDHGQWNAMSTGIFSLGGETVGRGRHGRAQGMHQHRELLPAAEQVDAVKEHDGEETPIRRCTEGRPIDPGRGARRTEDAELGRVPGPMHDDLDVFEPMGTQKKIKRVAMGGKNFFCVSNLISHTKTNARKDAIHTYRVCFT